MTEIKDKDLDKTSGGLNFVKPGGGHNPTDPENTCPSIWLLESLPDDAERKCKNCNFYNGVLRVCTYAYGGNNHD